MFHSQETLSLSLFCPPDNKADPSLRSSASAEGALYSSRVSLPLAAAQRVHRPNLSN